MICSLMALQFAIKNYLSDKEDEKDWSRDY